MASNITVVTPPDDILHDGYRLLCVGLDPTQTQLVSDTVKDLSESNVIVYLSDVLDIDWILDKKLKSNLIIFNADIDNQTLVGYLAAQKNSCYLGILKSISVTNNRAIYNRDQLLELMEENTSNYG